MLHLSRFWLPGCEDMARFRTVPWLTWSPRLGPNTPSTELFSEKKSLVLLSNVFSSSNMFWYLLVSLQTAVKGGHGFEIAVRMDNLRRGDWDEVQNSAHRVRSMRSRWFLFSVFMSFIWPTKMFILGKSTTNTPYSWNMVNHFSFGCHVIDGAYVRTYVRVYRLYGWSRGDHQKEGRGVLGVSWQVHIFYIGHSQYGQLTAVKTGQPLTSIPWPYRRLICQLIKVTWFIWKLSADQLIVLLDSEQCSIAYFLASLEA